ncbi:MAG: PAS domain-containing protein, partial [Alphaproteobacteria bacterium]|nr:PAS domain-containing protein [Alphaproteobacteria bacterium]
GDLFAVGAYAEAAASGAPAPPPRLVYTGLFPALVRRLARTWEGGRADLERLSAATETIFDHLPVALVLVDADRTVVRTNAAAQALVGKDVRGADLALFIRAPALLEAADALRVATTAGGAELEVEFGVLLPVDRRFRAGLRRLPSPTFQGGIVVIALFEETEGKRTEQMRVDFIANASHELRTPLSVLVAALETVRGSARDDPAARERFLAMMGTQAERMTRLVNDLLSLSRIELNENVTPSGTVSIPSIVGRALDTLRIPAQERGIRIDNNLPADFPPVRGDESELIQVFVNLIDNAIKYGRPQSTVYIEPRALVREHAHVVPEPGSFAGITVRDEGEGIADEHLPRLTERFYRVDTARSRAEGGTGLGLAIVKHIVNHHRGGLQIESRLGRGSSFTVYLPVAGGGGAPPGATARR